MMRFAHKSNLPASRVARIVIGVLLIIGGLLWFLPVLGIWMLPLGILVLSVDLPIVRRWRRRFDLAYGRWRTARGERRQNRHRERDNKNSS